MSSSVRKTITASTPAASLLTLLLALLALAHSARAHFTLDYPQTRGFDEDIESDNFCGGFHDISAARAPWYYRNGPVAITSHHDSATVNIYLSLDEKPTGPESFLKTSAGGASIPPLRKDLAISGQGEFCFHANASALDVPGSTIADGTNATIMVEFISVHGHLYQCSDVRFTSDASVGANLTCTDSLKANAAAAGSTSSTPASTSSGGPAPSATAPARSGGSENAASSISPSLFGSLVAAAAAAAVASALGPGVSCLL